MKVSIIKLNGVHKSNSSDGNWVVEFDFKYPSGLKANHFEFFWYKSEALGYYGFLQIGQEIEI